MLSFDDDDAHHILFYYRNQLGVRMISVATAEGDEKDGTHDKYERGGNDDRQNFEALIFGLSEMNMKGNH